MLENRECLSAPIEINGVKIKNRIVVPPMADFGATHADGLVNSRHLEHYSEFADGGAGLVIIEACSVCRIHEMRNTITLCDDSCIPGMELLARAAKRNGTTALVQLLNAGMEYLPYRSASDIPRDVFCEYRQEFVDAAERCKRAGFDGVELHAAHRFYLDQIIETSCRSDEYGGAFENRVRLLIELICEIKARCGQDFIVSVRFGNRSTEELVLTGKAIEAAGGNLLNVSTGFGMYNKPKDFPYDARVYAASLVKRETSLPVICVGNISDGDTAEQILRAGYADMVAVGRGHLCDPAWGSKVLSGRVPFGCLHCKNCMWRIDGSRCPMAIKRRKAEKQ